MHSVDDLVVCLGDFNGHMGRNIYVFYGGYGVGQMNLKGRMPRRLCLEKELCVSNTLFKRGKEEGDI